MSGEPGGGGLSNVSGGVQLVMSGGSGAGGGDGTLRTPAAAHQQHDHRITSEPYPQLCTCSKGPY